MVGHVDHGKTTLVSALSGIWTDRHSEEIKRGISIRLGYADTTFRKCPECDGPGCYTIEKKCTHCNSKTDKLRTVSFVDSPGHETLMATMLSGAAIMDGAVLVIAASEACPQPQTQEHLTALDIVGVKNIVIVQNKVDLVTKEEAIENYEQIKKFVEGTVAENAPIIPLSAQHNINIDSFIMAMEKNIPIPERSNDEHMMMLVARSFDINKPGAEASKIVGGVIGGSISRGRLRVKDNLEIRPGRMIEVDGKRTWMPVETATSTIMVGGKSVKEATPGGLIGVGTTLDPAITRGDSLVGQVAGEPGTLPPVWEKFTTDLHLLERVVGITKDIKVEPIKTNESLMLSIGTAATIGIVKSARKEDAEVVLKRPVCAEVNSRVAISRRIGSRWHLIGFGIIKN